MAEVNQQAPIEDYEVKIDPKQPEENRTHTQKKNICFTKFTKPDHADADAPKWDENTMEYMCYQVEIAPKTGRFHFQGCCIFKKRITLNGAARALGVGWGNGDNTSFMRLRENAINYCQKKESAVEGTFREFGLRPKGGAGDRTDLTQAINECKNMEEMVEKHPNLVARYSRGLETIFNYRQTDRKEAPHVRVFWGETGSGKSHNAREIGGNDYYVLNCGDNLKWWPGYQQQKVCILEEFDQCDPKGISRSTLFTLLDKGKLTVQIKGGHVKFNSPYIIITSHNHPRMWVDPGHWPELKRRLNRITRCKRNAAVKLNEPIEDEIERFI